MGDVGQLSLSALSALCDNHEQLGLVANDGNARALLGDALISRIEPCSEAARFAAPTAARR